MYMKHSSNCSKRLCTCWNQYICADAYTNTHTANTHAHTHAQTIHKWVFSPILTCALLSAYFDRWIAKIFSSKKKKRTQNVCDTWQSSPNRNDSSEMRICLPEPDIRNGISGFWQPPVHICNRNAWEKAAYATGKHIYINIRELNMVGFFVGGRIKYWISSDEHIFRFTWLMLAMIWLPNWLEPYSPHILVQIVRNVWPIASFSVT